MSDKSQKSFAPIYIVLFFIVLSTLFAGFAYIAIETSPGVVTEEAYNKGVAYNTVIQKAEAQEALHYKSKIDVDKGAVRFTLMDMNGNPVDDSDVWFWFYRPSADKMDSKIMGRRQSAGVYVVPKAHLTKGLWEIRVHADTKKGDYQASRRVEIR